MRIGADAAGEFLDRKRLAGNEVIGPAPCRVHPPGQGDDPARDMVDRHEIEGRALTRRHVPYAPFGDQLEGGVGGVELADRAGVGGADHDRRAGDRPVEAGCAHQPLARRLARFIAIGKARFG